MYFCVSSVKLMHSCLPNCSLINKSILSKNMSTRLTFSLELTSTPANTQIKTGADVDGSSAWRGFFFFFQTRRLWKRLSSFVAFRLRTCCKLSGLSRSAHFPFHCCCWHCWQHPLPKSNVNQKCYACVDYITQIMFGCWSLCSSMAANASTLVQRPC